MAEDETPKSRIKLPATMVKELKAQEVGVVSARRDIQTLKKLGLETKELEDKLNWAEEARKTLLKEFS
ncbi:hypothetical protein LCGC14_1763380 [marine sediment metagenome]|uniref:Uncharacterized protein n=1 Tax=marine sediment metagenome TaxID=412755 RepID=A0A0F9HMU3_9ZZZZ